MSPQPASLFSRDSGRVPFRKCAPQAADGKSLFGSCPESQKEAARRQVEALEAVQPADLGAGEIGVRIGANWVPIDIYQQFMVELLTPGYYAQNRIKILRSEVTGQWAITEKTLTEAM